MSDMLMSSTIGSYAIDALELQTPLVSYASRLTTSDVEALGLAGFGTCFYQFKILDW